MKMEMLVAQSCPTLCDALWTTARQAPLSMGFSRQEDWSGLPGPPPGDLPDQVSHTAGIFLTVRATREAR